MDYEPFDFDFKTQEMSDYNPPIETTHLCLINVNETIWEFVKPTIHKNVSTLQFKESDLIHLEVPDGISTIYACCMNLETVYLPDSIEYAYLRYNLISKIELPTNIIILEIDNNRLRTLSVRGEREGEQLTKMLVLDATDNPCLKKIDFTPPPWPIWVEITCDSDVEISEALKAAAARAKEEEIREQIRKLNARH